MGNLRSLQRTGRRETVGDLHFPKMTAGEQVAVPEGTVDTMFRVFRMTFLSSTLLEIASGSKLLARGLADRQTCQQRSCSSYTSFLWKTSRESLGAFWPSAGETAVTVLFSAEPQCPPWPWQAVPSLRPSLSPDGKAGDGAQYLTGPWPLSRFLTHDPRLSCFAFISICSPISPTIYKQY